jgi:hypothetical protein
MWRKRPAVGVVVVVEERIGVEFKTRHDRVAIAEVDDIDRPLRDAPGREPAPCFSRGVVS